MDFLNNLKVNRFLKLRWILLQTLEPQKHTFIRGAWKKWETYSPNVGFNSDESI